jgi:hypothetical protein
MKARTAVVNWVGAAALLAVAAYFAGRSPVRFAALYVTGAGASVVVPIGAAALGMLANRLCGDRIYELSIGRGPRIGTWATGSVVVAVHLVPLAWRAQVIAASDASARRRAVVTASAVLPIGLLALPASGGYRAEILIGWAMAALVWLIGAPVPGARRSRLDLARAHRPKGPIRLTPEYLAVVLGLAFAGELERTKAELARCRTGGAPVAVTEGIELIIALVECDYPALLPRAGAALQRDWGDWTPTMHGLAQVLLCNAVPRAAEAGQLPLADALSWLAGLEESHAFGQLDSSRAIRALLAREWEEAARFARKSVRHQTARLSLADELCTLAMAEAGCGRHAEAEAAWHRACRLAPDYPRLEITRRRVGLNQITGR